eukprot:maker-scaffold390_size186308-snap-gene-0.28 protein:Tk06350 transcript:maker-scaffold390_size186308-snap-gene-0.28-mRNA-1 annotation:"hypothetical protein"
MEIKRHFPVPFDRKKPWLGQFKSRWESRINPKNSMRESKSASCTEVKRWKSAGNLCDPKWKTRHKFHLPMVLVTFDDFEPTPNVKCGSDIPTDGFGS